MPRLTRAQYECRMAEAAERAKGRNKLVTCKGNRCLHGEFYHGLGVPDELMRESGSEIGDESNSVDINIEGAEAWDSGRKAEALKQALTIPIGEINATLRRLSQMGFIKRRSRRKNSQV